MASTRFVAFAALSVAVFVLPGAARAGVSVSPTTITAGGSYTVSWTEASGGSWRAYLRESANGGASTRTAVTGTYSKSYTGKPAGSYAYKVQIYFYDRELGAEVFEYETNVATVQVVGAGAPGTPGAITGPQDSSTPSYALSWGVASGAVARYELRENGVVVYSGAALTATLTGKQNGTYTYAARACNAYGCSVSTADKVVKVELSLTETVADAGVVGVPGSAGQQGWVGTIPGEAATEGGSASYRVAIEIPPSRGGMQPAVGLDYGSRQGNGIAGVGWSLSAAGTVYRCPRTLRQDGANAPVTYSADDRLCWSGQRLVATSGVHGGQGSQYRTEVDEFARITLVSAGMDSWSSVFRVEHKSGRVSVYRPLTQVSAPSHPPDTWHLVEEYDPQGNCVAYTYSRFAVRGEDEEWVLSSIGYTGAYGLGACSVPDGGRHVEFDYTANRADKRTTYTYGVAHMMTARLSAIRTSVGSQPVRRYELSYRESIATGRSLLESVKLCAGGVCGAESLPPSTFEYEERGADFVLARPVDPEARVGEPPMPIDHLIATGTDPVIPSTWRVGLAGDYDGDGTRDWRYVDGSARRVILRLSAGDGQELDPEFVDPAALEQMGFADRRVTMTPDVDNDGRSDLLGAVVGVTGGDSRKLAFASYKNVTLNEKGVWTLTETSLVLPDSPPGSTQTATDYDGDGRVDVAVRAGNYPDVRTNYHRGLDVGSGPPGWEQSPMEIAPQRDQYDRRILVNDLNGDGTADTFFDRTLATNEEYTPYIQFFMGPGRGYRERKLGSVVLFGVCVGLGGSPDSFTRNKRRRWLDVNGDGLLDIYEPGFVYVNRGGRPDSDCMFRKVIVNNPTVVPTVYDRPDFAMVMDVDVDGADELMVPVERVGYQYCFEDWDPVEPTTWCGAQFDTDSRANRAADKSVFRWDAFRFVERSDGTYDMVRVATNLRAPINARANPDDYDGDGMPDVGFGLWNDPTGGTYGVDDPGPGYFISVNRAPAPDLMRTATNGVGSASAWTYQPLSRKRVEGCDVPVGGQFYRAHHDDPNRSFGYVFFTSSMWTVSRFETDHGLDAALPLRKTCYRYEDAMLDVRGLGFQGFKKIVAEEQNPPAAGETAGSLPGRGTASASDLRVTTEFLQEFPFTSRAWSVKTETATGNVPLAETTRWWHAVPTAAGAQVVYPTATVEKKYDLASPGTVLATTTSATEVAAESGEPSAACTFSQDHASSTLFGNWPAPPQGVEARAASATKETRTLWNDSTNWWLGRVDARETVTDFWTAAFPAQLDVANRLHATKSPKYAAVTCPDVPDSTTAKRQRTSYTWNGVAAASNSRRKVASEQLSVRGVAERTASYTYGAYGNVSKVQVAARDVLDPANALATTYTYDTWGYFVAAETNAVGHTATVTTDAATGQETSHQAVQGGPTTRTQYDALGRVLSVTTDGAPTVHQRLAACGACGDIVIARQTLQAGAPRRIEYLDRLGRVRSTATEGFDGRDVVTEVEFNERGLEVAEHAPRYSDDPAIYRTVYEGFDALGRAGKKTVERDPSLHVPNLVTTYTYTGFRTVIDVAGGATTLHLSRTTDARGRLVETTQRVTSPTTHDILTRYLYDPAGAVTHIVDSAGNDVAATYDDLGRKKTVTDPDRGTWTYGWDGLGRLMSQQDARGSRTKYEYDLVGRPERRFVWPPGAAQEMLEASWYYDPQEYAGGPVRRGVLDRMEGQDGFIRKYRYDALLRPEKVTTTIPANDTLLPAGNVRTFAIDYGYDKGFGRQKAIRYPNGATVVLDYGPRGHLLGETEWTAAGARGKQYRLVKSETARGQVTEQLLGNCAAEVASYDASAGMVHSLTALRPKTPEPPAVWTVPNDLGQCPARDLVAELGAAKLVRQVVYGYDPFLNLARQVKNVAGTEATETFGYDELQRLKNASRTWSGATTGTSATTYAYDDLGNILTKSDYGSPYQYGNKDRPLPARAGPHAVASVAKVGGGTATFSYDANGNLISGDGRTVDFDPLDRPVHVTQGTVVTEFSYAPDGGRYRQRTSGPSSPRYGSKTVYYVGKEYEVTVWNGLSPVLVEERAFVGGSVVLYKEGSGPREPRYVHLDRLGSVDAVTANDAATTELLRDAHGYDPFGGPRARQWTSSGDRLHPDGEAKVTSNRGFTGHEHLDNLYLIHMNGRVYDYRLGRFLSVDPIISDPANSQSINPYSYIGNNPLSGTDPTGYSKAPVWQSASDIKSLRDHDCRFQRCDFMYYGSQGSQRDAQVEAAGNGATLSGAPVSTADLAEHGGPQETAKNKDDSLDGVLLASRTTRRGGDTSPRERPDARSRALQAEALDREQLGEVPPRVGPRRQGTREPPTQEQLDARAANIMRERAERGDFIPAGPVNPATGLPVGVVPPRLTPEQQAALDAAMARTPDSPRRPTAAQRDRVFEASKDPAGTPRCDYCGTPITRTPGQPNTFEADHRLPWSRGGPTSDQNLAPSCRDCNRSKGARTPEEFFGP